MAEILDIFHADPFTRRQARHPHVEMSGGLLPKEPYMPYPVDRPHRSYPSPPAPFNRSAAAPESGGATARHARHVLNVIDACCRRDIAALTGLSDADLRAALTTLQHSGAIRKRQGLDASGKSLEYFEPTGALSADALEISVV